jgi:bacteriocin biosynthesis cyclodehydratase domain-containing protein
MSPRGRPERPLIAGLYHVVVLGGDEVRVANSGRSVALSGPGLADRVGPALDAFDGRHSVEELEGRFGAVVTELLEALVPKGLIVDGTAFDEDGRSAHGLAALALGGGAGPEEAAHRLAFATVVVAGCGPVGGAAALQLAKAGIGRLRLADRAPTSGPDVAVSPVLHADAKGRRRDEAIADLCQLSTDTAVEVTEKPLSTADLDGADLVVLETAYSDGDRPPADSDASTCLEAGVAHVLHGQDALEAEIGPVLRPGGVPCHRCMDIRRLGHVGRLDEQLAYRRRRAQVAPGPDAFLAAHTSVLAGLLATTALRALMGPDPVVDRRVFVLDLATMTISTEQVLPIPECPTCGTGGVGMG